MLRGLSFYHGLTDAVKKYNVNHVPTTYSIQTNGTLIDGTWIEYFKTNDFLVGISLDGYRDIHDLNRRNHAGKGTFYQVQKNIQALKKHQVKFNTLCVVTRQIAQHPKKVYRFYKNQGIRYLQFIPCIESFDRPMGHEPYSLTPELYGEFLIKLFCEWYEDLIRGAYISIRMFDNIVNILNGRPAESCDMKGVCSKGTVVEADGSVYPCDFYVLDEWRAGNILTDDFEKIIQSDAMNRFVELSKNIDPSCRACKYFFVCRGGCRRHKEPVAAGEPLKNHFCTSYKMFYNACLERLYQVARWVNKQEIT